MPKKVSIYKTRVRYGEVDQMGVVYYGNYFLYLESARTGLLRDEGFPYTRLEEEGILLPVSETKLQYKSSAVYDDEIVVETTIGYVKNASIKINYKVKKEDGTPVAAGYTIHPFVNKEWDIMRIPDHMREILKDYLEE